MGIEDPVEVVHSFDKKDEPIIFEDVEPVRLTVTSILDRASRHPFGVGCSILIGTMILIVGSVAGIFSAIWLSINYKLAAIIFGIIAGVIGLGCRL